METQGAEAPGPIGGEYGPSEDLMASAFPDTFARPTRKSGKGVIAVANELVCCAGCGTSIYWSEMPSNGKLL